LLVGLRGVGKTVLLSRIGDLAQGRDIHLVQIEAPEGKAIAELIAPELRRTLLKMNLGANAAEKSRRALRALRNFVGDWRSGPREKDCSTVAYRRSSILKRR
jgi:hypothetical protein